MNNRNFSVYLFIIFALTKVNSLPLDTTNTQDEKVAVYIPYDIKYVPVEVPEENLSDILNFRSKEMLTPIVLNKDSIVGQAPERNLENALNNFKTKGVLQLENGERGEANKDATKSPQIGDKGFIVIPHSVITKALQIKTAPKSENLEVLTENPDVVNVSNKNSVVLPVEKELSATHNANTARESPDASLNSSVENADRSANKTHLLSKRQATGYYYRPVFRFSKISTSKRRVYTPTQRRGALVGYLNDRDLFPTVA